MVSIVIPAYNSAAFLPETIESCLSQSYPDVEVIVVDDGSTDNTQEVVARFPVRYIRIDNGGVSVARNVGLENSAGQYLVFLDADDRLTPNGVALQMAALAACPGSRMAVGNHSFISAGGSWIRNSDKNLADDPLQQLLVSNFIECPAAVLFERSLFAEAGIFDRSLRGAEDYDLFLRAARYSRLCVHGSLVSEYRLHDASLSRDPEPMLRQTLRVMRRQREFAAADPARAAALQKGLRFCKRKYGRQLALYIAQKRWQGGGGTFLRRMLLLAREYPAGVLIALVGMALPHRILTLPERRRMMSPLPEL